MIIDFDSMPDTVIEHFKGGEKHLASKMYYDGNMRIMRGILEPGASIGLHRHEGTCEVIIMKRGEGTVIESDGEHKLLEGQCHYCKEGEEHSLVNTSDKDLEFYGIVPSQATSASK